MFCGEQNDKFTEEAIEVHYWKSCPMLQRCTHCSQVIISIFKLNELKDRLRRSERGAELKWAESQISEIKATEKKLFRKELEDNGTGRKK